MGSLAEEEEHEENETGLEGELQGVEEARPEVAVSPPGAADVILFASVLRTSAMLHRKVKVRTLWRGIKTREGRRHMRRPAWPAEFAAPKTFSEFPIGEKEKIP